MFNSNRDVLEVMPKNFSVLVHLADYTDLKTVKAIADACRNELGFVPRVALEEAIREGRVVVAKNRLDQSALGFAHFRCTRYGYATIYEIAIRSEWRGNGVGRELIKALAKIAQKQGMQSLRLKCPIDLPANGFYSGLGFTRITVERGKSRALVVWEKPLPSYSGRPRPTFFLSLTNDASAIRKVIRLWDESGDPRDPFRYVIFTPLFSSEVTIKLIHQLKEERGSVIVFDSGGYQVQMGKTSYEELFDRLLHFYRKNEWADWYILPDHVPHSADSSREVEFKVRETLDFARLFVRMMPDGFVERAVGVVHGETEDQVRRCVEKYADIGLRYIGFGSFGTSGPNGSVNMVSQKSLGLLGVVQSLVREYNLQLHIFGIGSPIHLVRLARAGISPDSFDSAGWWKAGGFGNIFFPSGHQLHITEMRTAETTLLGIERQKKRSNHECPFCNNLKILRHCRLMRVMHNLAVMLDTAEHVRGKQ